MVGPALALAALIGIRGWAAWDEVVIDYDVPPRFLEAARPSAPADAQALDRGRIVEIEFALGKDGRVDTVTLVRSVPPLDDAVMWGVCAWRFEPARRKGMPVRTLVRAPAAFQGGVLRGDFSPPVGGVVGSGLGGIWTEGEPVACPR